MLNVPEILSFQQAPRESSHRGVIGETPTPLWAALQKLDPRPVRRIQAGLCLKELLVLLLRLVHVFPHSPTVQCGVSDLVKSAKLRVRAQT